MGNPTIPSPNAVDLTAILSHNSASPLRIVVDFRVMRRCPSRLSRRSKKLRMAADFTAAS